MSFPKPSAAITNSRMPMGNADTMAATANMSSRAGCVSVEINRIITLRRATPPDVAVTIGVMWVISRTGA